MRNRWTKIRRGRSEQPKGSRIERIQPSPDTLIYHLPRGRHGVPLIVLRRVLESFHSPSVLFCSRERRRLAKGSCRASRDHFGDGGRGLDCALYGLRQRLASYLLYLSPGLCAIASAVHSRAQRGPPHAGDSRGWRASRPTQLNPAAAHAPVIHVTFTIELRAGFRTCASAAAWTTPSSTGSRGKSANIFAAGGRELPAEIPTRLKGDVKVLAAGHRRHTAASPVFLLLACHSTE